MRDAAPVTIAVLLEMSFICEVPSAFVDGLQFQKPSRRRAEKASIVAARRSCRFLRMKTRPSIAATKCTDSV
jgi:hypothetical protein